MKKKALYFICSRNASLCGMFRQCITDFWIDECPEYGKS